MEALFGSSTPSWAPIAAIVAGVIFLVVLVKNRSKGLGKIPYVKGGLPFFGQVFEMIKGSPWDTMDRWATEYGSLYKIHLFGSDALVVSDPDWLKVILSTKMTTFRKDLEWTYKPFLVILGDGVVTSHGENWRRQRVQLSGHLRNNILEFIPALAFSAYQRFCKKLDSTRATGGVLNFADEFRHLTLQVIAQAVLSISPEESDRTFAKMYLPIVEEGNLRTWDPTRAFIPNGNFFQFQKDVKALNDYVIGKIYARWELRQQEAKDIAAGKPVNRVYDLLDKTMSAVPAEEWGEKWAKQLRDEVKTFILAGHETSASMLTWALYELILHPELMEKLREEGRQVFGQCFDPVTRKVTRLPENCKYEGLKFSESCLRESLRKYSNVPTVTRVPSEDVTIGDITIPKGTTVMINIQGVHHNPEFWPEPLEYRPERFYKEWKPYSFLPFADGPRVCLGQHLALLESKMVLAMFCLSYDFEIMNKDTAGNKHQFLIPIIPADGHHFKVL